MRARLATTVGGAAASVSRLAGKGDGSVIGGRIGLRLEPDLLSLLAAGRQVVLVTGTNGKTTTTRLITAALAPLGGQIASNVYGANMDAGAVVGAQPHARRADRGPRDRREVHPVDGQGDQSQGGRPAEPEPRPDGPGGRDLAARPALAGGAGRRARLPGGRQRRRPAGRLGGGARHGRSPGWPPGRRWREDSWCCPNCGSHLQRDGDDWSCRECGGRRPAGELDAPRRPGDRPVRPVHPARAGAPRPGQPGQRGHRARGGRGVRRAPRARAAASSARSPRWPAGTRR